MDQLRYEVSAAGRRRLSGRTERRGIHTGFSTWGAWAFGSVFVAVGGAILLVGLRIIPVDPKTMHAPWWVLTVTGLVFALAGTVVWGMAARQQRAERRRQDALRRHTDEPAQVDYDWHPDGYRAPRWAKAVKALAAAAGLTLFLSIFNYWAFGKGGPWLLKATILLFDLILVVVWWQALVLLGRALKFGGSRISFARFPYHRTDPVLLRWHPGEGLVQAARGTFTLRCVEEWFETRGSGKHRSRHLVHEEVWSATWHLEQRRTFQRSELLEFRFELPSAAPATELSAAKPRFWEFEVKLDLPGLDFEEAYLVPIY